MSPRAWRLYLSTVGVGLAALGLVFGFFFVTEWREQKSSAYARLRAAEPSLRPSFFPQMWLQVGEGLGALGNWPSREVLVCREEGEWLVQKTNRLGFWGRDEGLVDLLLLGDSFVQGYCVDPAKNWLGQLEASGQRVASLGLSGNGPLLALASLREYAPTLRPRTVLWFVTPNDLVDFRFEQNEPELLAYLTDPRHRRGCAGRSAGEIEADFESRLGRSPEVILPPASLAELWQRSLGRLERATRLRPAPSNAPEHSFAAALRDRGVAREMSQLFAQVRSEVPRLVVVLIPFPSRWQDEGESRAMRELATNWRESDQEVWDLSEAFGTLTPSEALNDYARFRRGYGHFRESGYRRTGEWIKARLR